jgi:hypothetical protein
MVHDSNCSTTPEHGCDTSCCVYQGMEYIHSTVSFPFVCVCKLSFSSLRSLFCYKGLCLELLVFCLFPCQPWPVRVVLVVYVSAATDCFLLLSLSCILHLLHPCPPSFFGVPLCLLTLLSHSHLCLSLLVADISKMGCYHALALHLSHWKGPYTL